MANVCQSRPVDIATVVSLERRSYDATAESSIMLKRVLELLHTLSRRFAIGLVALGFLSQGAAQAQQIMDTEFFEVVLVTDYREVWTDEKSGARLGGIRVLRPIPPPGFFTLGDVAIRIEGARYNIDRKDYPPTIALRPKPGYEHLLARPLSAYTTWDSRPSPVRTPGFLFSNVCPGGFEALGGNAETANLDNWDDNYRCVSKEMLAQGAWVDVPIWSDVGSGANGDASVWRATYRNKGAEIPPNVYVIPLNTFTTSPNYDRPTSQAWALRLPKLSRDPLSATFASKGSANLSVPQLLSPNSPGSDPGGTGANFEETKSYTLPFYVVKDNKYSFVEQWLKSPTYRVERVTRYKFEGDFLDNSADCELGESKELSVSKTTGWETSTAVNWFASVAVSASIELNAAPLGVGASTTLGLEVTAGGGMESASARQGAEETASTFVVPPGTAIALYRLKSEYKVFRQGETVPIEIEGLERSDGVITSVFYRLPGWTPEKNCPRSDILLTGPVDLQLNRKYPSRSGDHYLLWDNRGLAVYTNSDSEIWNVRSIIEWTPPKPRPYPYTGIRLRNGFPVPSKLEWDTFEQRGIESYKPTFDFARVSFSETGMLSLLDRYTQVAYKSKSNEDPNRPKRTSLYLTDDGALEIVAPTGRVIWTSQPG